MHYAAGARLPGGQIMRYDEAFRSSGYHTALLTTFSFDPTVFENVLLVAMRSRGCRNIGVLADMNMVNRTLSEVAPAPRAGTAYHLAKKSVTGAFHPKIVLQLGEKKGRLMLGSANLTGAGLVGNLETVSTVVVSEEDRSAAPLMAEAVRYFEAHADEKDQAMRDVLSRARARTPWLADVEPKEEVTIGGERVAFLAESASAGIAKRFRSFVGDDPIDRLIVVSPYADGTLEGFSRLREEFGTPPTSFVVDAREHDFTADTFQSQIRASLHSAEPHALGGQRRLHAKVIIANGARADYVLAGSANASIPGLYSRFGVSGNAEAGIARSEPSGTAIARLRLADCLSINMPLSNLSLRRSARTGTDLERTALLDGGSFWIEHGVVFWRPPVNADPEDCRARLMDGSGAEIAVAAPVAEENKWSLSLEPDVGSPRSAVVIFPNLCESAPVPIAILDRLQTNAGPPRSRAASRILAELEGRDDIDIDDYERAMKLLLMSRPDEMRTREPNRKIVESKENEEHNEGEILPEAKFGEIAESAVGRQNLKAGPISEMRRLVNAFLGLKAVDVEDGDELDPLADHIKNSNTSDQAKADREGDNGGESKDPSKKRASQPKGSMTKANARADKLVGRVEETCRALARADLDPLNLENAIRIHLLINVFLSHCAPVGEKASVQRPILAVELPRSWVRILGRLIMALEGALKRTAKTTSQGDLDEECIEALATILCCAGLLLDVSLTSGMPRSVVAGLETVNASLAGSVGDIMAGRPTAEAAMRQKLSSLDAKHRPLAGKCSQANRPKRSAA